MQSRGICNACRNCFFCSPFLYKYIYKFSCLLSCVPPVLPYPYCSTCLSVLEYLAFGTRVLSYKYCDVPLCRNLNQNTMFDDFSCIWSRFFSGVGEFSGFSTVFAFAFIFLQNLSIFMFCNIYLSISPRLLKIPKMRHAWKSAHYDFSWIFSEKK